MAGSIQKGKLSLDQYARLYDGDQSLDLTVEQLNQIVFMHGFIRLHRRNKTHVVAALESMDLVDPRRSTLDRSISCGKPLTVEEVRADLESMEWQCCRIVSLKSLEFGSRHSSSAVFPSTRGKENVGPTEDVGRSNPGGNDGPRVVKRRRGRLSSANKQMKVGDLDHHDFPLLTFRQ